MTIFVNKGDAPLTDHQLHKRTQLYIDRDWPEWKRERSIRLDDGEFDSYMVQWATDMDTNRVLNVFNQQLSEYRKAAARLARYVLIEGRPELREPQPTGDYDESGDPVMVDVEVQTAVDPIPEFVKQDVIAEVGTVTTETVRNPLVVVDEKERAQAQAVIATTPNDVIEFAEAL